MLISLFEGVAFSSARKALTYNGLTMNDSTDPDTAALIECNVVAIDEQYDGVVEPKSQTHGLEVYPVRKMVAVIRIDGVIRAPSLAALYDKVRDLNAAFDPVNAQYADSASERNIGFLPLTFSSPTSDTANYATGFIPMEYYVRSLQRPVTRSSQFEGTTCQFSLLLQAADPRAYFQTAQSADRDNAGTLELDNSLATFPSWPTITIDLSGTGSQVVALAIEDGDTVSVDLTDLTASDTVVVDMENHEIRLNGSVDMSLFVSGTFWELPADTKDLTVTNTSGTLAGNVEVTWGRAFV